MAPFHITSLSTQERETEKTELNNEKDKKSKKKLAEYRKHNHQRKKKKYPGKRTEVEYIFLSL